MNLSYYGEIAGLGGYDWHIHIYTESEGATQSLTFDADEPVVIEWDENEKHETVTGSQLTLKVISPGDRSYVHLYAEEPGKVVAKVYRRATGTTGDATLYWTGSLDPEFYEEPYEMLQGYTVELTFSDFAMLDRLKYDMSGQQTLGAVLRNALSRLGLPTAIETHISTMHANGSAMTLDNVYVNSANFYDTGGEAMTLEEVVDGILQPLALKMEQRIGKTLVYDLHALYQGSSTRAIEWGGSEQTLGTDRVYNNVTISWGTYADGELMPEATIWDEDRKFDSSKTALNKTNGTAEGDWRYWTYHLSNYKSDDDTGDGYLDATDAGFTLWTKRTADTDAVTLLNDKLQFYKIVPQYDGNESEGIAISWFGYGNPDNFTMPTYFPWRVCALRHGLYPHMLAGRLSGVDNPCAPELRGTNLFRLKSIPLQPIGRDDALLRVSVNMLLSNAANPYEETMDFSALAEVDVQRKIEAGTGINTDETEQLLIQSEEEEKNWKANMNFFYVPFRLIFTSASGYRWVWSNRKALNQDPSVMIYNGPRSLASDTSAEEQVIAVNEKAGPGVREPFDSTLGEWTDDMNDFGYMAWYDPEDREKSERMLGWNKNRQAIRPTTRVLSSRHMESADGQYIPLPPLAQEGGTLSLYIMAEQWMCIEDSHALYEHYMGEDIMNAGGMAKNGLWGIWGMDYPSTWSEREDWQQDIHSGIRWLLMEVPQVELINKNTYDTDIDTDDVEYKAEVDPTASSELELSTICGTSAEGVPTARGGYYHSNGAMIREFSRNGRTTQAEELLIGTIYSQYASRSQTLTGEVDLNGGMTWGKYTMNTDPGRYYMPTGVREALRENIAEVRFVELKPETYKHEDE